MGMCKEMRQVSSVTLFLPSHCYSSLLVRTATYICNYYHLSYKIPYHKKIYKLFRACDATICAIFKPSCPNCTYIYFRGLLNFLIRAFDPFREGKERNFFITHSGVLHDTHVQFLVCSSRKK